LDCGSHSNGEFGNEFVLDRSSVWQEVKLEPCSSKDGVTNPGYRENCGIHSNGGIGFVPERQLAWKNSGKDGFLSGSCGFGKDGIASNQKGYGEFAVGREFSI
jgi:hypothetical protein